MAAADPTDPRDLLRAEERAREHAEFRSLLIPSREVPRFESLTDTEPDAEADAGPEAGPETEVDEPVEPVEELPDDEHDAFRRVVVTKHAIPRFEPLEGAGEFPGLGDEVVHRRRSRRRRSSAPAPAAVTPEPAPAPETEPAPAAETETPPAARPAPAAPAVPAAPAAPATAPRPGADRRETFILVAVLAVLIVLAALYAAAQQADQPSDSGLPQGASRVSSQPLDVRA
ncbi:hypothetical protein [Nocardioides daeguensis]|uniref:Uncharacterized protein n=1 Tax=Nocardioides daeguensis TaxID=908359 RepID=A0ABP6V158_9ACTN|nr:hypothetical protein [Nocardioides daeguensis]MBV6727119.1 hypothetical protein [Nocardioides daeguensis]MCR1771478.1 hypothetical protein [Nocardioides daeguensis]